ncbi:MAG: nucleoside-diphosphate sugar epimerase/dehydratase, partial [Anaerocolumna sp.]
MGSKRDKEGDLLILLTDILGILVSFILAMIIRYGSVKLDAISSLYLSTLFVIILGYVGIHEISNKSKNIFKRGFAEEGYSVFKDQFKILAVLVIFLYVTKQGSAYSRVFVAIFLIINYLVTYVLRSYLKVYMLAYYKKSTSSNKVLLITTSDRAQGIIKKIRQEHDWSILISSIAIIDKDMVGEDIDGILVLGSSTNLLEIVRLNVVDEVFINLPYSSEYSLNEAILEFEKMGVSVHVNIEMNPMFSFKEKSVENFAGQQVITFSTGIFDSKQELLKRLLDVIGG